ncbi:hypothetical protein RHRU231_770112 [Rhodococcus ruber]|uniref:Uncharacterized protein n=1 Tax=Rhodococcus ruber TaxID=1830 RepID=A0A098BTG0_9NOCA|nr:hypothetical protein RHRU231_770112 [Rhodococcus ruber]
MTALAWGRSTGKSKRRTTSAYATGPPWWSPAGAGRGLVSRGVVSRGVVPRGAHRVAARTAATSHATSRASSATTSRTGASSATRTTRRANRIFVLVLRPEIRPLTAAHTGFLPVRAAPAPLRTALVLALPSVTVSMSWSVEAGASRSTASRRFRTARASRRTWVFSHSTAAAKGRRLRRGARSSSPGPGRSDVATGGRSDDRGREPVDVRGLSRVRDRACSSAVCVRGRVRRVAVSCVRARRGASGAVRVPAAARPARRSGSVRRGAAVADRAVVDFPVVDFAVPDRAVVDFAVVDFAVSDRVVAGVVGVAVVDFGAAARLRDVRSLPPAGRPAPRAVRPSAVPRAPIPTATPGGAGETCRGAPASTRAECAQRGYRTQR